MNYQRKHSEELLGIVASLSLALVALGCSTDEPSSEGLPSKASDSGASNDADAAPSALTDGATDATADGSALESPDGGPSGARDADAPDDASTDPPRIEPRMREGLVLPDDSTVWCAAWAGGAGHGELHVQLRRVPSDAQAPIEEPYRLAEARTRARLTCSERPDGEGERMTLALELDAGAGELRAQGSCPSELPYGSDLRCSLEPSTAAAPLRPVFLPAGVDAHSVPRASGERCIAAVTDWREHGQVTGFVPEYMTSEGQVVATMPLQNEALMRSAQVGGTDEGAMFLAQGKLWFVFGDTSALDANDPLTVALQAPPLWRSNVLAYTSDFDVTDGYVFDGFETLEGETMAAERVLSPHDNSGAQGAEVTAIPLAGFGFTSAAGTRYRFLWFVSIRAWSPDLVGEGFRANYSTLAYVADDDPSWTRIPAPAAVPAAQLGPGAVWFDRYHRYLYFFGITPDRGAIRLARVPSTFDAIIDPEAYAYWNGEAWIEGGDPSVAIPLIDESSVYAPRSEISVAWNPAAEVWMMMLVNWYAEATPSNQVELWQAPAVTGPWTKVDADADLPNGTRVLQYGPMFNEHVLAEGGLHVPLLLSQFFPIYNVYHHSYRIVVAEDPGAQACGH